MSDPSDHSFWYDQETGQYDPPRTERAGPQRPSSATPEARRKERIAMAREICLHKGENPNGISRRGEEAWEKYEPLAGAVIREAERLFALRDAAQAATEPVAWLAEYDGHKAATTDPDTMRQWRDTLNRKITPLYAALPPAPLQAGDDDHGQKR